MNSVLTHSCKWHLASEAVNREENESALLLWQYTRPSKGWDTINVTAGNDITSQMAINVMKKWSKTGDTGAGTEAMTAFYAAPYRSGLCAPSSPCGDKPDWESRSSPQRSGPSAKRHIHCPVWAQTSLRQDSCWGSAWWWIVHLSTMLISNLQVVMHEVN